MIRKAENGLYINQNTQTLVKAANGSGNKFIIKGPIYNVANFLNIAKSNENLQNVTNPVDNMTSYTSPS